MSPCGGRRVAVVSVVCPARPMPRLPRFGVRLARIARKRRPGQLLSASSVDGTERSTIGRRPQSKPTV